MALTCQEGPPGGVGWPTDSPPPHASPLEHRTGCVMECATVAVTWLWPRAYVEVVAGIARKRATEWHGPARRWSMSQEGMPRAKMAQRRMVSHAGCRRCTEEADVTREALEADEEAWRPHGGSWSQRRAKLSGITRGVAEAGEARRGLRSRHGGGRHRAKSTRWAEALSRWPTSREGLQRPARGAEGLKAGGVARGLPASREGYRASTKVARAKPSRGGPL